MIDRREFVDHLDWVLRPPLPGWLVDQIEHTLELAIAGRDQEEVEVDCRRYTVAEVVEDYELQELLDLVRERAA